MGRYSVARIDRTERSMFIASFRAGGNQPRHSSFSSSTAGHDGRGGERAENVGHGAEHVGNAIESEQQLKAGEGEPRGGERRHQAHDCSLKERSRP